MSVGDVVAHLLVGHPMIAFSYAAELNLRDRHVVRAIEQQALAAGVDPNEVELLLARLKGGKRADPARSEAAARSKAVVSLAREICDVWQGHHGSLSVSGERAFLDDTRLRTIVQLLLIQPERKSGFFDLVSRMPRLDDQLDWLTATRPVPSPWDDLTEIGYIAPISNVPNILRLGVLSHDVADRLSHRSVADPGVQRRRATRGLHSFANLYLNPRNAMLYRIRNDGVVVVMIEAQSILARPDCFVTDRNAAVKGVERHPLPDGLRQIDHSAVFSDSWVDNGTRDIGLMQSMQAEVLIPGSVQPDLITRVRVGRQIDGRAVRVSCPNLRIDEDPEFFFR